MLAGKARGKKMAIAAGIGAVIAIPLPVGPVIGAIAGYAHWTDWKEAR